MDYTYFPSAPPPSSFPGHYMHMAQFPGNLATEESNGSSPDHMDQPNFLPYDASFSGFEPSPMLPPTSGSPQQSHMSLTHVGSVDSGVDVDMDGSQQYVNQGFREPRGSSIPQAGNGLRGSSEEKEMANLTPAQSRRKAQNRAAQRAFRERKERHVRDLEAKLTALESQSHSLQSDNERLKLALQRAETENEILRATSATNPLSISLPGSPNGEDSDGLYNGDGKSGKSGRRSKAIEKMLESGEATLGPSSFKPRKIDIPVTLPDKGIPGLNAGSTIKPPSPSQLTSVLGRRLFPSLTGAKSANASTLLPAAATWDLILSHPLSQQGLIDIGDVCERLRGLAKCDGQGPAFEEADVIRVVEGARRGGSDSLI